MAVDVRADAVAARSWNRPAAPRASPFRRTTPSTGRCASTPAPRGRSKCATSTARSGSSAAMATPSTWWPTAPSTPRARAMSPRRGGRSVWRRPQPQRDQRLRRRGGWLPVRRAAARRPGSAGARRPIASMSSFELRVPRDATLRLCTVNGGDVTLDRTSGDFACQSRERRHHAVRCARVGSRGHRQRRRDSCRLSTRPIRRRRSRR